MEGLITSGYWWQLSTLTTWVGGLHRGHTHREQASVCPHICRIWQLILRTSAVGEKVLSCHEKPRKHRSHSLYSKTSDAGLRAGKSSPLEHFSVVWTLLKMPTSLKENWVKCAECKLKSAKGEEMIVINISSIKLECGNYSSVFYIYRSTPEDFLRWHNVASSVLKGPDARADLLGRAQTF